jgi:uncharacterized protein (TIGR03435 family)
MSKSLFPILIVLLARTELAGQSDDAGPRFEVASIKPSAEGRNYWPTGGPGTKDPTTFRSHTFLGVLLKQAFDLGPGQMVAPNWLWQDPLFLIVAKVSPQATKDQIPLMLQALLKERFHLAYHFEKRELAGYRMVVAKNGPKLKQSADSLETVDPPAPANKMGKDGFPNGQGRWNLGGPVVKYWMKNQTMRQIATFFGSADGKPVVDATGLTGRYDITLYWESGLQGGSADSDNAPATPGSGQPLLAAVQSQLGLKLEPTKVTLNVFVLDHMDKVPTEN